MSENENLEEQEEISGTDILVVCKDCFKVQDPDKVMKSSWYKSGVALPPCNCGGQTMEIQRDGYDRFVENRRKGVRY